MDTHGFHGQAPVVGLDVLSFEKGSEHPGHLFVTLHQPDEKIVGAEVVKFFVADFRIGAQFPN